MNKIRFTALAILLSLAGPALAATPHPNAAKAHAYAAARSDLLDSLARLKRDNLYLTELSKYQARLIDAAKADPASVGATARRPLQSCLDTPLKPLCGLFRNTFASAEAD